jgi:site-specific DNA recombinase
MYKMIQHDTNNVKRAAIYLRVSTDEQTKGYGLPVQKGKLEAFVSYQDYKLEEKHIYTEEGFSGTLPIASRPELKRLFDDAKNKEFDVVLVYRLDRFFRKTRLLLEAIDTLTSYGVGFRSTTEEIDTTNSTGKFMTTMLGAVAEMERDTIRERTMGGRLSAARAGKWVTGVPPYGYKVTKDKKLVVVEEEARLVKMFYEWVIYEKLSLKSIEAKVNQMSINSPKYHSFKRRKTHNYWYARTIGRILTNEIYTGTAYFRKYKRPFKNLTSLIGEGMTRPTDDWIKISVPPIISQEIFEKAKEQLTRNRDDSQRNMKREYLYSKLIYCGYCGFKMFCGYQPPKKNRPEYCIGTRYYHGVHRKTNAVGGTNRCQRCEQYAESRLEPIWDCLKGILQNPKNIKPQLERYKFKGENQEAIKARIAELRQKIRSIDIKEDKLIQLYLNQDSMGEKQYNELSKENKKQKDKIETDITRLEQSLLKGEDTRKRGLIIEGLCADVKSKLDVLDYQEKMKVIHLFIERINLFQKSNYAEVIFKFSPKETIALDGSSKSNMKLVLDVKTYSEHDRRVVVIKSNPLMYRPKLSEGA